MFLCDDEIIINIEIEDILTIHKDYETRHSEYLEYEESYLILDTKKKLFKLRYSSKKKRDDMFDKISSILKEWNIK